MLKLGVFVVLAAVALVRAAEVGGEADASASAMDAQLAQLREEVTALQSQNDHLVADAKALGMEAAPAPLVTASTAELDAATSEASAAELDAEIAAAVVDTSATDAEAEAADESAAEADQSVEGQVDIYADGANAAAEESDDTANAVDEAAAPVPVAALAEVDAQHKVEALVTEEKAVDAEMAGLEGELQALMDESDEVLLSNAQSDADEEVAAEEATANGEDEAEAESEDEAEAEAETSVEAEEADVAESLDDAFAFRQIVESASEGEEALASAEASLPSSDRDDTPIVDAAAEQVAETADIADAVADAEAELAAEETEAEDEEEAEVESEDEDAEESEDEAEDEAEEEVDEDAVAEAEVDVDTELELEAQALESADESLDSTSLVETQTAESAQLASLMDQENTFRTALDAERAEKSELDRQIAQERYISAEAHRELAARIAEINGIITRKSGELGVLERQRRAKEEALKKVDAELLSKAAQANVMKTDNARASKFRKNVIQQIEKAMATAKAAQQQKNDAVAATAAATAESEKARVELAALRAQMAAAQRTLFRSRISHSFGLVEPPKKKKRVAAKYGMYLREGEESGAEDSGQAFWRRVVARRSGKGFYEPYYERVLPAKKAKKTVKKCTVGKDGKKKCRRVVKPKRKFIRPQWAPEPPKKCKKGFLGKLCRLKKKLAKLTVDMSVVPEFVPERVAPVEYVDRVPKRQAQVQDLLRQIQKAERIIAMMSGHRVGATAAPAAAPVARFMQLNDEEEAEDEEEVEAEEEAEAEEESEEETEDESEAEEEAEEESEDESEEEESEEADEESEEEEAEEESEETEDESEAEDESEESDSVADGETMRFAQALVQANADMQARLQAAADATANTAAASTTEVHAEAEADAEAHADAQTETVAETHADSEAEVAAAATATVAGAVEAEAVQNLAATKRWSPSAVEAQELTSLDKLIAKMQNFRHKQSTRSMKRACVKGDAACLKVAQEADANKLKKKLAKFTLKPTIVDVRRKMLLKRLALLRKIKKAQKKLNPEFITPRYAAGPKADFVKPEYAGDKNKKIHIGLPSGWVIPKRLKRN